MISSHRRFTLFVITMTVSVFLKSANKPEVLNCNVSLQDPRFSDATLSQIHSSTYISFFFFFNHTCFVMICVNGNGGHVGSKNCTLCDRGIFR